jgi:copper transport protein
MAIVPASASGHAELRSVARAGDGTLRAAFSAPVESAFLRFAAETHAGSIPIPARIDPSDDQTVVLSTPPGLSAVAWRVLSGDGHVTGGVSAVTREEIAGAARTGAEADPPGLVLAHLVVFAGLLGLLGLVAVRFGVVGPAWRSGGPRPPGLDDSDRWRAATAPALARATRRWWGAWWTLAIAAGAGLVLAPVAMCADLDAGIGDLATLLGDTRWGRAWIVQAAGLVVAAGVALAVRRRGRLDDAAGGTAGRGSALALPLLAAAAAISWAGHASSGSDAGIGIALDAVHVWATGAWLGGLVALVCLVPDLRRLLDERVGTRLIAAIVVRFSALAITCVGLLVVTGVYRAIAELRGFGDLTGTGYGQALLVKLAIFLVLLGGGAFNRLVLHPRLERAALGLEEDDRGAGRRIHTSVSAELLVAGALLVAVSVLVSLPPP